MNKNLIYEDQNTVFSAKDNSDTRIYLMSSNQSSHSDSDKSYVLKDKHIDNYNQLSWLDNVSDIDFSNFLTFKLDKYNPFKFFNKFKPSNKFIKNQRLKSNFYYYRTFQ